MYPEYSFAYGFRWVQCRRLWLARLTCVHPRHHAPASPPPSDAEAAAWHSPQFAPISPIISMSEMLHIATLGVSLASGTRLHSLT